jgi:ribonuclease Z
MSLETGETWSYQQLKFQGLSLSGIRTALSMPELSMCFDVAQGYPFLLNLKNFFLTHGHLDHAAGVPYIISQKAMNSQPPASIYMPQSLVNDLDAIMKIWQKIEKHDYQYNFVGLAPDDEVVLNPQYYIKASPSTHRVDSLGYTLFEVHKKLRADLQGLSQEQILECKKRGENVQDTQHRPLVTFSGDTQIEFLDSRPWIRKSKVLFLEATYIDNQKTIEQARQWGHTHLDEIIPRLDDLECEQIVIIHVSSRYPTKEALKILKNRIPAKHQERVVLFPGR